MKYLLWLDDDLEYRNPEKLCPNAGMMYTWKEYYFNQELQDLPIVWVTNYEEFCNKIEILGMPQMISFDNDLGQTKEGIDCAKWLFNYCIENNLEMPEFPIHSANPIASQEIRKICQNDWQKYKSQLK